MEDVRPPVATVCFWTCQDRPASTASTDAKDAPVQTTINVQNAKQVSSGRKIASTTQESASLATQIASLVLAPDLQTAAA